MTNEMQESAQIQMRRRRSWRRRQTTAEVKQTSPSGGNEGERQKRHPLSDCLYGPPRVHNFRKYGKELWKIKAFIIRLKLSV